MLNPENRGGEWLRIFGDVSVLDATNQKMQPATARATGNINNVA